MDLPAIVRRQSLGSDNGQCRLRDRLDKQYMLPAPICSSSRWRPILRDNSGYTSNTSLIGSWPKASNMASICIRRFRVRQTQLTAHRQLRTVFWHVPMQQQMAASTLISTKPAMPMTAADVQGEHSVHCVPKRCSDNNAIQFACQLMGRHSFNARSAQKTDQY
uniref:Transposase n=1 Tax=Globodera pallida TaxID=36090 RepID=A0A183BT33_GLOPA